MVFMQATPPHPQFPTKATGEEGLAAKQMRGKERYKWQGKKEEWGGGEKDWFPPFLSLLQEGKIL